MKIAITGHTSGIGKGILEYYSGEHEVIGFSLENGYNINDYNRILEETKECDIFINNAYSHYTQSEIVSEWAKVHSNDKHLIISTSRDYRLYYTKLEWKKLYSKYDSTQCILKIG